MAVDLLPDSRTKSGVGAVRGPGGTWVPLYCAHCHAEGGKVPSTATFAFWLCPKCEVHGDYAHMLTEPDVAFWQRVHAEAEDAGLTEFDKLVLALDDPNSQLAKLLRDAPKGQP